MHIRKNYLFYAVFLGTVLLSALYMVFHSPLTHHKEQSTFNIAIISRESNFHTYTTEGFTRAAKEASNEDITFNIKVYITGPHNKILTTAIAEEILNNKFDLLVTVGAVQSDIAHGVNKKRNANIPHICIGAGNLVEAGLITSNEKPGGNVTGVSCSPLESSLPFKVFQFLKPHAKKILIPYCPHSSHGEVEACARVTAQEAEKYDMSVTLLPAEDISEAMQKIRHVIKGFDTVFCFEGDIVDDIHSGIGKLCSEHNITFFAGTLRSVQESAAAGFGVNPELSGQEAFKYAWRILVNEENPGDLPMKFVDNARCVAINKTLCTEQDMLVPSLLELCLSRGVVY